MTAMILQFRYMPKSLDEYPNRIREWRLKRGMTLEGLAEMVGTTHSTVGRMETGTRTVDLDWLKRFARALDVDPGQLLSSKDNQHGLSEEEQRMIAAMRQGDKATVTMLLHMADLALKPAKPDAQLNDETPPKAG